MTLNWTETDLHSSRERELREREQREGGMGERVGPAMAPLEVERGEERWRHFDSSVNAVSFGFVATAILIAMFLVMAIFERFVRPRGASPLLPTSGHGARGILRRRRAPDDPQAPPRSSDVKLDYPSPKMSVYAKGVSVLMPGHSIPTFIAHPAPAPCPPERISWPTHHPFLLGGSASNSS